VIAQDRPLFGFIRPAPPSPRKRAEVRCRLLEVMAASVTRDVPLGPVVAAAAAESRGFARRALGELRDRLDADARLGAALESCRMLAFPAHTVAAVQAAEGTPRLAVVLAAASRDDAEVENRRASVWAAAFYPLLVVAFVGLVAGGSLGPMRERLTDVMDAMEVAPSPALLLASQTGRIAGTVAVVAALAVVVSWIFGRSPALTSRISRPLRSLLQALPVVRGASRLGGGARMLRALEPCVRAGMPLHEALGRAAEAASCRAVTKSALAAAARADEAARVDDVANALLLPASIRARFALAATRAPDRFADAIGGLADDCARRYRDALDARMRWFQPLATLFVGALVLSQLAGIFAMLEIVRREAMPW
jgi:type II secretory pathway component PulF